MKTLLLAASLELIAEIVNAAELAGDHHLTLHFSRGQSYSNVFSHPAIDQDG